MCNPYQRDSGGHETIEQTHRCRTYAKTNSTRLIPASIIRNKQFFMQVEGEENLFFHNQFGVHLTKSNYFTLK